MEIKKVNTVVPFAIIALLSIVAHFLIASMKGEERSDELYGQALTQNYQVYAPVIPQALEFAGEEVPMDYYYVREALDRELLVNMYWQSNTVLIMKRSTVYFPIIEKILKKEGVPQDFKYLCVAESALMNLTSSAKAQGYWQFMKGTAEKYGLEVNDEVDERNDLELSTEAACKYIKDLYEKFGSWTAAAAAYNCGEAGMQKQLDLQKISDYHHLRLYAETSRYLYRILGFKVLMESPRKYGFHLRYRDLYYPLPYVSMSVDTTLSSLHEFARQQDVSYKVLKDLNPWMIQTALPNKKNKKYTIKLPVKEEGVWTWVKTRKTESAQLVEKF